MAAVEQNVVEGIPLVGGRSVEVALVSKVNNLAVGKVGADLMGGEDAPSGGDLGKGLAGGLPSVQRLEIDGAKKGVFAQGQKS